MTWVTGIVTFLGLWSLLFLCWLPVGLRIPEKTQEGFADSAPVNPRIKHKLWRSFLATVVVMCVLVWVLEGYGKLSF